MLNFRTIFTLIACFLLCSCSMFVTKKDASAFMVSEQKKAQAFESQTTLLNNLLTQVRQSGVPEAQVAPIRAASDQNAAAYRQIDAAQIDLLEELVDLDYKKIWDKFKQGFSTTPQVPK